MALFQINSFPIVSEYQLGANPFSELICKDDSSVMILFQKVSGFSKGSDNDYYRCIIKADDMYKEHILNVFSAYHYTISEIEEDSVQIFSETILHRNIEIVENDGKALLYNNICNSHNTITLKYVLSKAAIGSGFGVCFCKKNTDISGLCNVIQKFKFVNNCTIPLVELNTLKEFFEVYGFSFGNDYDQKNIAMELSHTIEGITYNEIRQFNCLTPLDASLINRHDSDFSPLRYNQLNHALFIASIEEVKDLLEYHDLLSASELFSSNLDSIFWENTSKRIDEKQKYIGIGQKMSSDEEFLIPLKKIRQGIVLLGSPGSGKGNELFKFAEQLIQEKIPFIIFESAKQELHNLNKKISDASKKINVWRPQSGKFILNPFAIPDDITLGEYRHSLLQMLKVCFKLDGALEEWFGKTLNSCFAKFGYNENSKSGDPNVREWGLHEFIMEYKKILNDAGYSGKTKDDMAQAGLVRLGALLHQNPDVYDTVRSIPVTELLNGFNLIQLNCLPTIEAKQSFATMLLISLGAYMQLRFEHSKKPLRLVIIMDESHNLLNAVENSNENKYSFADDFTNMILTLRSSGVGFIIADQSADNIPKKITDVCDTKIFIGPSRFSGITQYKEYFGSESETSLILRNLYRLKPGEGIFVNSEMPHGCFFRNPNIIDTYNLSKNYEAYNNFLINQENWICGSFNECRFCSDENKVLCNSVTKSVARQISEEYMALNGGKFAAVLAAFREATGTSKDVAREELRSVLKEFCRSYIKHGKNIVVCAYIQLLRKAIRELGADYNVDTMYSSHIKNINCFLKQEDTDGI